MAAGSLTLERGLRVYGSSPSIPTDSRCPGWPTSSTHRAGIYRLVGPLAAERLVVRDVGGTYTLGLGLLSLASAVRSRLQEVAVRELRVLAEEVGATTALTIRDGDEAVVAAVVEPTSTVMHIAYRPGLRHPIARAAPGLAILAGSAPKRGERAEVAIGRKRGWTVTTGELLPGATGVAAPIVVPDREAEASISAVWVEPRDPAAMAVFVVRTARAIAAAL